MSDKDKRIEDMDKVSDEIVEATMREIYDELQSSESDDKENELSEAFENNENEENQEASGDVEGLEEIRQDFAKAYEEAAEESREEDGESREEPEEDVRVISGDQLSGCEDSFEEVEEADEDSFKEADNENDDGSSGYSASEEDDDEFEEYDDGADEDFEEEDDEEDIDDDDIDIEDDPRIRRHRRKKKAAIIAACIVAAFAAVYIGISIFFFSHFYFFTEINGRDFSAKSVEQVESYMEKQVQDYELKLEESDGGTEVIDGTDISLKYVKGKDLKSLLKKQNPFLWITALWDKPEIEASIGVEYDKDKLNAVISSLNCMKPEEQVESVSAYPEFQGTEFAIKPEVVGTQIDTEKFTEAVNTAISGFQESLDISKAGAYILPRFTSESEEVKKAKDAMNSYLGANITYDLNPYTEVVDASVISQWVTVDGDMNVTFNEEAVRAFVQSLADKYNTYGKTRTMTTAYGNAVEVSGGNYGWVIDKDAEYAALTANIQNAETITREPEYSSRAVSHEGNDFGNTYVEIDLTNQHMWYFQNGQAVLDSDIVTGNPNKGNATPQGTYVLAYKQTNQVLRGKKLPDGTYEYESPVSYWMPFNGGIGLHDANWQSAFGGSRYQTHGSHGCVNLPPSVAATLYSYIDAGTPVICHY